MAAWGLRGGAGIVFPAGPIIGPVGPDLGAGRGWWYLGYFSAGVDF